MMSQDYSPVYEKLQQTGRRNGGLPLRHAIRRAEYVNGLRERDRIARSGLWEAAGRRIAVSAERAALWLGNALLDWVEERRTAAPAPLS